MTSTTQPDLATVAPTTQTDQPGVISAAPSPSAPAPAPAAVKAVAKRVVRTPAKKAVAPVTPVAKVAVKPVAKKAAPRAAVKSAASATPATPATAPKAAAKAPVKAEPKTANALSSKQTEVKLLKAKKPKLVRDSFTIPKLEYLKLEELKHRSVKLGNSIKKSELIRAGILALAAMSDASFLKVTKAVPTIKTGRPAKD